MMTRKVTPVLLKVSFVLTMGFLAIPSTYEIASNLMSGLAVVSLVALFVVDAIERHR